MARVAPKAVRAAAESNVQSIPASGSVLQGEVGQLTVRAGELAGKVARLLQEGSCKVEDVLFERVGP